MKNLHIWGRLNSINVQKVLWLCEDLKIPFERTDAGMQFGVNKTLPFLQLNPNGLVPVIKDNELVLWESHAIHIRYFAKILLACFWCLAFGLYFGEFLFIGYNMLGHVAVITMAFTTWVVFKQFDRIYSPRGGTQDWLRMPDRGSRCDEMTEEQRLAKVNELNKYLLTCHD